MAFEDNKKFLSKILVIFELLLMAQSFVEGRIVVYRLTKYVIIVSIRNRR